MSIDLKGFAMKGAYYTSGTGILNNLFASWGLLADAPVSGGVTLFDLYDVPRRLFYIIRDKFLG